jgi:hypothetical protein
MAAQKPVLYEVLVSPPEWRHGALPGASDEDFYVMSKAEVDEEGRESRDHARGLVVETRRRCAQGGRARGQRGARTGTEARTAQMRQVHCVGVLLLRLRR